MPEPDLLLENGVVITLDRGSTIAEALSVRDGRIVAEPVGLGKDEDSRVANLRRQHRRRPLISMQTDSHTIDQGAERHRHEQDQDADEDAAPDKGPPNDTLHFVPLGSLFCHDM